MRETRKPALSMPLFPSLDDYYELMKPRVMRLSIFTALVGMLLAPGDIDISTFIVALVLIAIGAGAAGVLNMWYDADIDAVMRRTAMRPIPLGKITTSEALSFGIVLTIFSVLALGFWVNWIAASLLGFTIFFYSVIYTIGLKRFTAQNIVIGGASGALVPMIGWAVVSPTISLGSLCLFTIIFLWTPPHFWSLALIRKDDYADVKIPMLPNVSGESSTRRQIMFYSVLMFVASLVPYWLGLVSYIYGISAILLGLVFLWYSATLLFASSTTSIKSAKNLFFYSIFYLSFLFLVLLFEALYRRFEVFL